MTGPKRPSIAGGAGVTVVLGALAFAAVVTGSSAAGARVPPRAGGPTSPCGRMTHAPHYRHVVWIVMENYGYSAVVDNPSAPYLRRLGEHCAIATNYRAVAHPSLPNYLALTSGTTDGIADDGEPAAHRVRTASIFSELRDNWRALEESMPSACDKVTSGSYAARHNPAVYYTSLDSACAARDVPLRFPLDLRAAFTFITPNICDDMHNCSVSTGSAWLSRVVRAICASSEYRRRTLALFIVWDESDTGPANQVAAYVIAPSIPRGLRVRRAFDHYSLLRTTEQLLGVRPLGAARTAPSMLEPMHLGRAVVHRAGPRHETRARSGAATGS